MRLHRGPAGTVRLRDQADAAVWLPYLGELAEVEVAARVGPPDESATVDVGAVTVHSLPYYEGPGGLLRRLVPVLRELERATRTPRLSLFRLPGSQSLLGAAIALLTRRRYAVEIVGDPVAVLHAGAAGPVGRLLAPLAAVVMRRSVRGALAVRYETRSTLQDLYPARPDVPCFSYSTVELADEDLATTRRPTRPGLEQLLAIGTQDQLYKGHDDLLRALALLEREGRRPRLTIVGDGRHHDSLRALAAELGVADRVDFAGRVNDRTRIRELFAAADLFCMPSRTEGLPRALIEAMAAGLPAVGTSVGGIPELLTLEFLVPPDRPDELAALIARLADDPALRSAGAEGNRTRALGYTTAAQQQHRQAWCRCVGSLATTAS